MDPAQEKNIAAVALGLTAGVITSLVTVLVLSVLMGLSHEDYVTLLPKSITTAIGMGVSEELGGYVTITVAVIVVTGVLGNILESLFAKYSESLSLYRRDWRLALHHMPSEQRRLSRLAR